MAATLTTFDALAGLIATSDTSVGAVEHFFRRPLSVSPSAIFVQSSFFHMHVALFITFFTLTTQSSPVRQLPFSPKTKTSGYVVLAKSEIGKDGLLFEDGLAKHNSAVRGLQQGFKTWIAKYDLDGDGQVSIVELGSVFVSNTVMDVVAGVSKFMAAPTFDEELTAIPISRSINRIEEDIKSLDASFTVPELSKVKISLIIGSAILSMASPAVFGLHTVELLIPAMTAVSAAVGVVSEYQGKAAVANAKEIVALGQVATAESEIIMSQAERVKTVLPLCVGIAATAAGFAVLLPELAELPFFEEMNLSLDALLLFCPLISVLSAAIAGLATSEAQSLIARSIDLGKRRFATASRVGRRWNSEIEIVESQSFKLSEKWTRFALGILPAPLISVLCPGDFEFQTVVCSAVATAQAAFSLSVLEKALAEGEDSIAMKARARAMASTYTHQATRAGALLPYTSALGALCVAGSAAVAEFLPLFPFMPARYLAATVFPVASSAFAFAAAGAKKRCEVDTAAATFLTVEGMTNSKVSDYRDPVQSTWELINLTIQVTLKNIVLQAKYAKYKVVSKFEKFLNYLFPK